MPFKKIEPLKPQEQCRHPEHNPPSHYYYKPGHYTWVCPACGKETSFTVRGVIY